MRQFVESLKRLYVKDRTTEDKITKLYEENKITKEEFDYLLEK